MKLAIKINTLFLCFFVLFMGHLAFAENRTFIKEYTYQAGDEDSKNSSRVIALREVKRLLLEELGTYLESETEVRNFQLTKDQITTLTAGIVQTEIIEEKWDGRVYWLKSKIAADSDKVVQSIDAMRKDRDQTRELESMKQKSDELLREIERLRKAMDSAKNGSRESQQAAYDQSIRELSAADWIEKGHALSGPEDDFKGAFNAYSSAIELDPVNIKAYYFRARISEKNQAMSDYYKILSIEPKDSEAHLIRAWTYKELDRPDPALQEFGDAIAKARGNKEKAAAYFDRGRYYFTLSLRRPKPPGSPELAVRDFSSAIALDPENPSYLHNRATSYWGLGQYDLAIEDFNAGIRLDPKSAGLFSGRGQLYQLLQKPELAVADLSRAIELEGPDHLFASHDFMLRAMSYEKLGKFDLAIQDWTNLLKREPDDPFYLKERADLYRKIGQYDQAIEDYSKSIVLNPREATTAYYGRALTYASKGDSQKSIQDLRNAIQLDPGYKAKVLSEAGFNSLQHYPDFIKLIGK